ncbi:hypothetical protein MPDQ_001700 [Monascus purpureus]|uniref:Uncharacterized protein n=1 Tax=Monascus purpureus TaxID=5098 RepID=A0A507QQN6_MONPU|nr:hypothetical protein MPDQ_001700 [Monascus purpureus]BDD58161.1 hypothetical protein MAP00_003462 [Monascus purpureus]
MEYRSVQLLLDTRVAIHQNPVTAQLYPYTPKISNLILLENESNPVVEVLGHLIKQCRPPLLADGIAVYLVMYGYSGGVSTQSQKHTKESPHSTVPPFYNDPVRARYVSTSSPGRASEREMWSDLQKDQVDDVFHSPLLGVS